MIRVSAGVGLSIDIEGGKATIHANGSNTMRLPSLGRIELKALHEVIGSVLNREMKATDTETSG